MSEWVIAMNIKPGELYRYEIKDEIKISRFVIKEICRFEF